MQPKAVYPLSQSSQKQFARARGALAAGQPSWQPYVQMDNRARRGLVAGRWQLFVSAWPADKGGSRAGGGAIPRLRR
eukprot:scaffold119289_cov65-Phaeocystis_antarctica.AAC.7